MSVATVLRRSLLVAVPAAIAATGHTIPNIAVARRIAIGLRQTGLAAARAVTHFRNAVPVLSNGSAARAATWPAIAVQGADSVAAAAVLVSPIALEVLVSAIAAVVPASVAEPTALAAAISPGAAVATEAPSAAAPVDSMDQAHGVARVAVPRALGLVAAASAEEAEDFVAAAGVDRG